MGTDDTSAVTIAELRTNTLTGAVQREIERMILSGDLEPGSRLNEAAVAEKLMVSRGPVREACRALAELGLVHLIPNRGVFIKQLSKADAVEVYDLRAGLTALAAFLLCPVLTAETLAQLDGFVGEMEIAAGTGDFAKFNLLNLEFHDCIVRSTENGRLIKLYRGLVKEFYLFRVHGLIQRESLLESNIEHREIMVALKAKNADLSYEASLRHVNKGKQRMLLALDASRLASFDDRSEEMSESVNEKYPRKTK